MKKLGLIFVILFLASCSKEEVNPYPCVDGMCNSAFWIDRTVQPDAYQDQNGYWHIEFWGPRYFTIKGEIDQMHEDYVVNDIPLTETRFDSDYWIWFDDVTFVIPRYSPFGQYTDPQFTTPIPIANQMISVCFLDQVADPLNIAGYQWSSKVCGSCPYAERMMGTYSANTYKPQQQFYLDPRMKTDTLQVFIKSRFNYDLGEEVIQDHVIKIIVD